MIIAKVIGTLVAPAKKAELEHAKLLIVKTCDLKGHLLSEEMLALDMNIDAGVGDYVLVAQEGDVVKQVMNSDKVPANTIVMGVIDDWDVVY